MRTTRMSVKDMFEQRELTYNVSLLYMVLKRLIDAVGSVLGMILFSPLMILIFIIAKLHLRNYVLSIQERYGLKGIKFKYYTFNTAFHNSEDLRKPGYTSGVKDVMPAFGNMKQATKLEKLIICKFDKLPLLFNVFKGEMSFVGPRAALINEISGHKGWYNLRMSVKPGITGLWYTKGGRSISFDDMVRLDLKYIRECNVLVDFKIAIRSIFLLFRKKYKTDKMPPAKAYRSGR